ncbi:MAG: aldo/keto reductase [Chloroflexi bacterium]|nr:aldo/keto reductase [Chloroflexota bacterium]
MEYRRLGRTGLEVSLVSLGTGGPSRFGQERGTTPAAARRLVRRALDHGVNFFDTAQDYGDSESLLGQALDGVPRDDYLIATKCTYRDGDERVIAAADVSLAIDRALARLKVDVIDVMQIHGLMGEHYDEVIERHLPVLKDAQAAGKIRFIGVTERFTHDPAHVMLRRAIADDHFDTLMVGYSLLHQGAERHVLPAAQAADIGVIIMIAVRRALSIPERLREVIADLVERGQLPADAVPADAPLGWLVRGDVTSVVEAAYRFVREHNAVDTVLTGTSRPEHLDANVAALLRGTLPGADQQRLRDTFGHLEEALGN